MKYSFMSFSAPEATLAELFALAKKYGYDGIEPRIDAEHAHGIETSLSPAERQAVKRQATEEGVAIACIATSLQFAIEEKAAETIRYGKEIIDLAGDLGCPALRVFGGPFGEAVSREQAFDQCVAGLAAVAGHAADRQVVLAFETHDSWTDPAEVANIIRQVNNPSVRVNWDIMHPFRQSGVAIEDAFETLREMISHVHVHDGTLDLDNLTVLPMGTGAIDHQPAIQLLKKAGYSGYISGEWILSIMPEDFQSIEHLGTEIATLKGYEA